MERSEKAILIEGLRKLSADAAQIADALEGKQEEEQAAPAEVVAAEKPTKEEAETYSLEQVRRILADKARSGHRAEVKAIIAAHGAERLSDITDPEVLSLIAKEAEVVGNG